MAGGERRAVLLVAALLAVGLAAVLVLESPVADAGVPAGGSWAVAPNLALAVDTSGYEMPTALAFVPQPGRGPSDPLYFVTELRGKVKVVTNDRQVRVFATVPAYRTKQPLPGGFQAGLAGLCLDAERGFVFVTYTYEDRDGVLRNNITRFSTRPGSFGLTSTAQRTFTNVLGSAQAAPAHQVGGCVVRDGRLLVGIGDGGNPAAAADLDQLLGKVLCLTVEGRPCPTNRFARDRGPRAFVWAFGFRNPFGLALVGSRLFVAENGIDIDRFLEAREGEDHHWDGSDASIGVDADFVFYPAISPVQVAYHRSGVLAPEWNNTFFLATSGGIGLPEPARRGRFVGILGLTYDESVASPSERPRPLVQHRGPGQQAVAGVALGPDGLYMAELIPNADGTSNVLRVRSDAANEHEFVIGDVRDGPPGRTLMEEYGCTSCHTLANGVGGGIGPSLDPFGLSWRLRPRLQSQQYREQVASVDRLQTEPFVSYRDERNRILELQGDERLTEWIKYKILEPKFDDPAAQMPDLVTSEEDAEAIAEYLAGTLQFSAGLDDGFFDRVKRRQKAVAFGFAVGVLASIAVAAVALAAPRIRRRRARTS